MCALLSSFVLRILAIGSSLVFPAATSEIMEKEWPREYQTNRKFASDIAENIGLMIAVVRRIKSETVKWWVCLRPEGD
jgi:hypothetical protein